MNKKSITMGNNYKTIVLKTGNDDVKISQNTNNQYVDIQPLLPIIEPVLRDYCTDYNNINDIQKLIEKHNIIVDDLWLTFDLIPSDKFWVNPNLLLMASREYIPNLFKDLVRVINYDPLVVYPYIKYNGDLLFSKEILDSIFGEDNNLGVVSNAYTESDHFNIYYSFNDVRYYLWYSYAKNNKDVDVFNYLCRLKTYIEYCTLYGFDNLPPKLADITYDITDLALVEDLNIFIECGGNLYPKIIDPSDVKQIRKKKLKYKSDNKETFYQNLLHKELGGKKEVNTPAGRIDLLTDTELIEIKKYEKWKSAIGQLLSYSHFYPAHKKILALFGNSDKNNKSLTTICEELDIIIRYL